MTLSSRNFGLVAAGGAVGAAARYEILHSFPVGEGTFPTTTLLVNVAGAFLLGLLIETVVKHERHTLWARPLLGIGVLGAFTTFSSLASETDLLVRDGRVVTAAAYVAASLVLGIVAAVAGLLVGGWRPVQPVPEEGES